MFIRPPFLLFPPSILPELDLFCPPRWDRHLEQTQDGFLCFFLLAQATLLPAFFDRPDVVAHDRFGVDIFGKSFSHFPVLDLYNLWTKRTSPMTVSPLVAFPEPSYPTLVVRDFNIHHRLPNPLHSHSAEELATSFPSFSWSSEIGFGLLNQPGVYTRLPLSGSGRPSVLDLSFASPSLLPFCKMLNTPLPSTGSDHVPIQIILSHPFSSPPCLSPNRSLTDWHTLVQLHNDFAVPPPPPLPTRLSLEAWFDQHFSRRTTLLTSHTPTKRPSYPSKPWWSPLLSLLRKEFDSTTRKARSSHLPADSTAANYSTNGYFKSIKAAKAAHWRSLQASATLRSIWTVKKRSLGKLAPRFPSLLDAITPIQINDALLNHFFPPQPARPLPSILRPFADCTALTVEEISTALTKCSPSSAPGPDTIPYSVWKSLQVHRIAPDILISLLGPLLLFGHHPASMKMANGVVLDKAGKPSPHSPSSFRIIVLLQTVSKILEWIVASRLSAIARYIGLLR